MKKTLIVLAAMLAMIMPAQAQFGLFNHVGANLGVGTDGISVALSTPITDYVQMRAGLSFMPKVTFHANEDLYLDLTQAGVTVQKSVDLELEGNIARTQGDIVFNIYPFGRLNNFFVAAGAYFGGNNIIKLKGHSDEAAQYMQDGTLTAGYIEIGDYKVNLEEGGNVQGALRVKGFRPYLGLGYGRPCPKGRVGFMIEAGVQFMGHMRVVEGPDNTPIDMADLGNDDDWQKWMNKLTVYPMLKFTLTGRLF